jgi:hypothetical protein
VNSEAHGGKFNDGPARKPKLYQMGAQISGVFVSGYGAMHSVDGCGAAARVRINGSESRFKRLTS